MEQTQARILTVLALLLLVATALLYGLRPEEREDPEATAEVWRVAAEAVERVEIERAEGRLVLARDGEGWRMEAPTAAEAEAAAVDRLLDALAGIERGVPISDAAAPEEYGLGEPPVARVAVTLKGGAQRELVVGDEAPVGFRTYVRGPDGGVVAVEGQPGRVLAEPASRFRDHRIFAFRPKDVRRVTLEGPDGVLSVHGEGSRWWVDGFTRADVDRVDDLVVGLLDLRFDTFMELEGLGNPSRTATVELEGGAVERLHVGERTPMGQVVWTDAGRAGVAFPDSLRLLGQGPTDLGDRRAFPIDPERVDGVAVTVGEKRTEALRHGPEWRVGGRVSPDAQVAVERLGEAAIHYRREPVPPPGEVWALVEVTGPGGISVVDVGQVVDGSFRVARDRAGGAPYLVPLEDLAPIEALAAVGAG